MISAIVPVWNGREHLASLLDSLDAQTLRAGEILAIDNGSSDGAPELARDRGARVIAMGGNAGFAPAVNRGIREARGEWIAILNTDVKLAPDYLQTLAARAAATDAAFATGKIVSPAGALDGAFDLTTRAATTWRAGAGMADAPPFDCERAITSAPFTAVLVRSEVFRKIGLLEEIFESYLEDVDFGLRCAGGGVAGLYVPTARAVHIGSASLGRWHPEIVRRISRNQLWLARRHFPARYWWRVLVGQLLWGGVAVRHLTGWAWLSGKIQGAGAFNLKISAENELSLLDTHLRSNEQFIRNASPDLYWRLYFLLTGVAK